MTKSKSSCSWRFVLQKNLLFFTFLFILVIFVGGMGQGEIRAAAGPDPSRVIIVDKNLQIVTIFSNTKEDVRPEVYLESRDGLNLPYTDSIETQYLSLKPALNFSKTGAVYERDVRAPIAVFKMLFSLFAKLLHFPW